MRPTTIADAPVAPWLAPFAARLAALAPLDPPARLLRLDAWAREAGLATESGRALRFVPADGPGSHGGATPVPYELRIFEAGEVATRTVGPGARHDLCNALAWLAYPRAKARLNALHARAIACAGATPGVMPASTAASARGPLRDAATLFDENGALWIGLDADLEDALRAFDWHRLFVAGRERLACAVRVAVFGHALLEKLDAPYKAVTAHAWPLRLRPGAAGSEIDAALARALEPGRLSSRALCPLPVMGLPGWCEANRDPAFYNDAAVFRTGRRQAPGALPPTAVAAPVAASMVAAVASPARPVGPRPPRD